MEAIMSRPSTFGARLKAKRAELGLTLAEIEARSGVHLQAVAKIESGRTPNPTWETVCALAAALGVSTEYFREADDSAGTEEAAPAVRPRAQGKYK